VIKGGKTVALTCISLVYLFYRFSISFIAMNYLVRHFKFKNMGYKHNGFLFNVGSGHLK
jgi:hypothetical protein